MGASILIILLLNAGFLAALFRVSQWYKISKEEYMFHMLCMNLVMLLLYASKQLEIGTDYVIALRFFSALTIVYILMLPLKKIVQRQLRLMLNLFSN